MTPLQRATMTLAVLLHGALVWSVLSQPLDPHVPPISRRFLTASLSFDATHWPGPGGDFFALYHAGLQARAGKSSHELTESPRTTPYYFRYIYSPLLAATLGRTMTSLPPRAAYLTWAAVIESCLVMWLVVVWRAGVSGWSRTIVTTVMLVNQPYLLELHMGQFTFVAAALALMGVVVVERSNLSASAGLGALLLACATLLKTFPCAIAPALVRSRRARLGAVAICTVLLCSYLASSRLAEGPVSLGATDSIGSPHPGAESLPQALFVIAMTLSGTWLPSALPFLPGVVIAVTLLLTGALVLARAPAPTVGSSLMLLAFFVAFFHTWEHHYSAVILTATALLLPDKGHVADHDAQGLLVCLVLLALPTPFVLLGEPPAWSGAAWLAMSLSKALPLLVIFLIAIRSVRQEVDSPAAR